MIELYNEFEKTISKRSAKAMQFGYYAESREKMLEIIINGGDEYILLDFRLSGKDIINEYHNLLLNGDMEGCLEIYFKHGKPISKEESRNLHAATILNLQGHHDLAQGIISKIKADNLRSKLLPELIEKIQKNAHSDKQSEVAKKPRNKHHDEAIRIAKRTWNKYPHASKKGMCRKLYEYFHAQVSVDTLGRWIAKIKPRVKSKDTSFSLVL
ncbi:TPA: hypothetical protein LT059_005302 [Salmonella enterica subsp. enterica serovar Kodjovi]|nr:hypothetical protein [Salmonella enterica subsp. enterica serovar Kodjovi]